MNFGSSDMDEWSRRGPALDSKLHFFIMAFFGLACSEVGDKDIGDGQARPGFSRGASHHFSTTCSVKVSALYK